MALDRSRIGALLTDEMMGWLSPAVEDFLTEANAERILANPQLWFIASAEGDVGGGEVSTYQRMQRLAEESRPHLTDDVAEREIRAGRTAARRQLLGARIYCDLRAEAEGAVVRKLQKHGKAAGALADSIMQGIAERQEREEAFRNVLADLIDGPSWRAEAEALVGQPLTDEAEAELLSSLNEGTLQVMELRQLQNWQIQVDQQLSQQRARVAWRRDLVGGVARVDDGGDQIARLKGASTKLGQAIAVKLADLETAEAAAAKLEHERRLAEIQQRRERAKAELVQLAEQESSLVGEERARGVAVMRPVPLPVQRAS